jgi:hypothetical protein
VVSALERRCQGTRLLEAGGEELQPIRRLHALREREEKPDARNRGPDDFERSVSCELIRVRFAFASAKAHERVQDDSGDDGENHRKDDARNKAQIEDGAGLGGIGIQHPEEGSEIR